MGRRRGRKATERMTHKPSFITSSERGSYIACSCGWEIELPPCPINPLHTNPTAVFFQAGFNVGREYQSHVEEVGHYPVRHTPNGGDYTPLPEEGNIPMEELPRAAPTWRTYPE